MDEKMKVHDANFQLDKAGSIPQGQEEDIQLVS